MTQNSSAVGRDKAVASFRAVGDECLQLAGEFGCLRLGYGV